VSDAWQNEWFHVPRPQAKPFLKWAGGKRRIVRKILEVMGPLPEGATYFEPFLGSGALYFALSPSRAVLSDSNPALIESYRLVKSRSRELLAYLATLPSRPSRDQYYTLRDSFNSLLSERSNLNQEQQLVMGSLFVWLNHTCFNGLYRVNRAGQFNVPIGSRTGPYTVDSNSIRAAGRALRASSAQLLYSDYARILTKAKEGDRVYLDPPYEPIIGVPGFTDYTSKGFSPTDQKALADEVDTLAERGVRVVLSNSYSPLIRTLYARFRVHTITAPRSISRDPGGRRRVREVVVVA
jgi:DNA adenine methylase